MQFWQVLFLGLLGSIAGCQPSSAPLRLKSFDEAAVASGETPVTQSTFDRVALPALRKWAKSSSEPSPFKAMLTDIFPDGNMSSLMVLPFGRSLQKPLQAEDYNPFIFPRFIVSLNAQTDAWGNDLTGKLFMAYRESLQQMEVISYNDATGYFDFRIVKNVGSDLPLEVTIPPRSLCLSCHQSGTPILTPENWAERADAVPQVREASQRHLLSPIANEQAVSSFTSAYGLDSDIRQAEDLLISGSLWRACAKDPEGQASCVAKLLTCRAEEMCGFFDPALLAVSDFSRQEPSSIIVDLPQSSVVMDKIRQDTKSFFTEDVHTGSLVKLIDEDAAYRNDASIFASQEFVAKAFRFAKLLEEDPGLDPKTARPPRFNRLTSDISELDSHVRIKARAMADAVMTYWRNIQGPVLPTHQKRLALLLDILPRFVASQAGKHSRSLTSSQFRPDWIAYELSLFDTRVEALKPYDWDMVAEDPGSKEPRDEDDSLSSLPIPIQVFHHYCGSCHAGDASYPTQFLAFSTLEDGEKMMGRLAEAMRRRLEAQDGKMMPPRDAFDEVSGESLQERLQRRPQDKAVMLEYLKGLRRSEAKPR